MEFRAFRVPGCQLNVKLGLQDVNPAVDDINDIHSRVFLTGQNLRGDPNSDEMLVMCTSQHRCGFRVIHI